MTPSLSLPSCAVRTPRGGCSLKTAPSPPSGWPVSLTAKAKGPWPSPGSVPFCPMRSVPLEPCLLLPACSFSAAPCPPFFRVSLEPLYLPPPLLGSLSPPLVGSAVGFLKLFAQMVPSWEASLTAASETPVLASQHTSPNYALNRLTVCFSLR